MQYQILIEHPNQNGFVASVIGVPNCVATANTEEEAITSVLETLQARLSQAKIVTIELDSPTLQERENPFRIPAFKNDPTFGDFMEKLQQYRREANALDEQAEIQPEISNAKKLTGNPWIDSAGIWRDDPTFDDLMQKIEEYRREINEQDEPVVDTAGANG